MMKIEKEKLKRYFLGDVSEAEADEIELRLISDADFEGDIIEAETELVEDYLDGALNEADAGLFEENYLITPERRKNVQESAMLRKYASQRLADAGSNTAVDLPLVDARPSLLDRIRALVPLPVFAAALLLIAAIVGYIFLIGRGTGNAIQAEYATLNRGDLSDLDKYRSMPGFTALPGNLRGGGNETRLTALTGESAFVRLALPIEWKEKRSLNVRLLRSNTSILTLTSVRTYQFAGGSELRLLIPVRLLEKGSYRLEVTAPDADPTPIFYDFLVE